MADVGCSPLGGWSSTRAGSGAAGARAAPGWGARSPLRDRRQRCVRSQLRALAAQLGVEDRVNFLGHVETTICPRCTTSPSCMWALKGRGRSRRGLRHLARGSCGDFAPRRGRTRGRNARGSGNGVSGILADPYDPASLAAAIQKVLRSPALAAQLGAAGRRVAERNTAGCVSRAICARSPTRTAGACAR